MARFATKDNLKTIVNALRDEMPDVATTSTNGLMSTEDKAKLDGIDDNANDYSLPPATDTVLGGVKYDNETIKRNSDGQLYVQGSAISISVDELTSSDIDELFTPKYEIKFGYLNEGQYASMLETAYDANTNVISEAKAGDTVYAIIWYDSSYYESGSTVTDASGNTVQFTSTWGYGNPTTGIFAELDLSKIQRANGYAFALRFVMPDSPVTVSFACWYDE